MRAAQRSKVYLCELHVWHFSEHGSSQPGVNKVSMATNVCSLISYNPSTLQHLVIIPQPRDYYYICLQKGTPRQLWMSFENDCFLHSSCHFIKTVHVYHFKTCNKNSRRPLPALWRACAANSGLHLLFR